MAKPKDHAAPREPVIARGRPRNPRTASEKAHHLLDTLREKLRDPTIWQGKTAEIVPGQLLSNAQDLLRFLGAADHYGLQVDTLETQVTQLAKALEELASHINLAKSQAEEALKAARQGQSAYLHLQTSGRLTAPREVG